MPAYSRSALKTATMALDRRTAALACDEPDGLSMDRSKASTASCRSCATPRSDRWTPEALSTQARADPIRSVDADSHVNAALSEPAGGSKEKSALP